MIAYLAAQVTAGLAGTVLLLALGAWRIPAGLFVPAAWLAGTGALAVERLVLAQAGIPWTPLALALPWALVAAVAALRVKLAWNPTWRAILRRRRGTARRPAQVIGDAAAAVLILVWTAAFLWQATNQPLAGWDAWSIWFLKGRALYQAGGLPLEFFTDPRFRPYAHLDYPLLVPLTIAGTYAWTGDLDTLMKGWWPLLAGAAAAGIYWGLAGHVGRLSRLGGLVLLLGLPEVRVHMAGYYAGYADLPLAVFALFGALFLYRWLQRPDSGMFGAAALFFSLAGVTKNEGVVVASAGLGLLGMLALVRSRPAWPGSLGGGAIAAAVLLPWQWQRQALGLSGEFHLSWTAVQAQWPARSGVIWDSLSGLLTDATRFNLLWPLLPLLALAALLVAPRRWLGTAPLLLLVAVQVGAVVLAYVITPSDLAWHLATSADRVLLQPALLALPLGVLYLGFILDPRPRMRHSPAAGRASAP